ncbi:ABC transporter permease [Actinomyces ruminicola]|uniref:ABC-2 type transport system permease protein n=1 Tax=Actinomyces ruminicola TaxID=332524 RepID=A0A1G9SZ19_9ACTO|nr:ABC transporter permease [Actinomyces ruminicola]SDM40632.1 ABC-2 type transport system permease protein [Actinomyces ruminicola]
MSTFRTSLRIVAAHRVYVLVYLVLMSVGGLFTGLGAGTETEAGITQPTADVAVIDRDDSVVSRALADYVGSVGEPQPLQDSPQAIQDATAKDRIQYILIIPAGFGQDLQDAARAGTKPPRLQTVISYRSYAGSLMNVRTGSYLNQVYDYLSAVDTDSTGTQTAGAAAGDCAERAVSLANQSMQGSATARLITQDSLPLPETLKVYLLFSLFPLMASSVVAIAVLMDSLNRRTVHDRVSAAPVTGRSRGLGLLGACLVIGVVGWAWFFCLGTVVFAGDRIGDSAPRLGVIGLALAAYTLSGVAVGFLAGQLRLGENAANAVAVIGGMALSALAGAWAPLEMLPDAVVAVSRLTPGYWATQAVSGAFSADTASAQELMPLIGDCGLCALFAVAIAAVGLAVGRSRARESL